MTLTTDAAPRDYRGIAALTLLLLALSTGR